MAGVSNDVGEILEIFDEKSPLYASPQRSTALTNKLSSVLSASYADSEIRDALRVLDEKKIQNNPETRRRLRLDVQKDVIDCNGKIIKEFGHVAEVGYSH